MLDIVVEAFMNHWELGFPAAALIMMRLLMVPLLIYNMSWSSMGFKDLVAGRPFPTAIYRSTVFTFSAAALGYHALAFIGREVSEWSVLWSFFLQCAFMLGCVAAAIGRKLAITAHFESFYWLFSSNNLDIAVRSAQLNEVDPDYTEAMLGAAEAAMAVKIAKKEIEENRD